MEGDNNPPGSVTEMMDPPYENVSGTAIALVESKAAAGTESSAMKREFVAS